MKCDHSQKSHGFALIELLAVIAIIAILAALLLSALSKEQGIMCLNNDKQIMLAIGMYPWDHRNLHPPNPDDGNTVVAHSWCAGQAGRGNL